jgi:segregation and condensation protein B
MSGGILDFPSRPGGVDPELVHAVEALLFAAGEPLATLQLAEALEAEPDEVRTALQVLEQRRKDSGVVLERIAGGWQLRTSPRFALPIHRLVGTRPKKLGRGALEALAIIAYRQPVTRPEIDRMRGVDSGGVVKQLVDRGLVRTAGRAEDPGRPLLYRTTAQFLELFGLPDLAALPTIEERAELVRTLVPEEEPPGDERG